MDANFRKSADFMRQYIGSKKSVLIVDPSLSYRKLIKKFLENLGIQRVLDVSNYNEAKKILLMSDISLFIAEWIPDSGRNGLDFCREIRSMPKYRTSPIILMSTERYRHDVLIASEAEIDCFLIKPFSIMSLNDQIIRALRPHMEPSDYQRRLFQAQTAYFAQDMETAENIYLDLRSKYPQFAKSNLGLARIAKSRGMIKHGIQYLRQTIKINPEYLEAQRLLMDFYQDTAFMDGYYQQASILNQLSPDNPLYVLILAEKEANESRFQEAESLYRRAVMLSPCLGAAHRGLGDLAFAREDYIKAEAHYRKALDCEPQNVRCLNTLGLTYVKLERFRDGVSKYMAALTISPDNSRVLYNLGQAWEKQNILPRALECYERAVKLSPDFLKAERGYLRVKKYLIRATQTTEL